MADKSPAILKAMVDIMGEVGAVPKGKKNNQQGYQYRGIDDVQAKLQPLLVRHGVIYWPEVLDRQVTDRVSSKGNTLIYTALTVKYTFASQEDGSKLECTTVGEGMDSGDKSSNKAMSAALKYALLQVFCVPTEEMVDSEQDSHELERRVSQQQLKKISDLMKATETNSDDIRGYFKVKSAKELTEEQASEAITMLGKKQKKQAETPSTPADKAA